MGFIVKSRYVEFPNGYPTRLFDIRTGGLKFKGLRFREGDFEERNLKLSKEEIMKVFERRISDKQIEN